MGLFRPAGGRAGRKAHYENERKRLENVTCTRSFSTPRLDRPESCIVATLNHQSAPSPAGARPGPRSSWIGLLV